MTNRSYVEDVAKYVGHKFDEGPKPSDFDFAIVDPRLHAKATQLGIEDRGNLTRTRVLEDEDLSDLGLKLLEQAIESLLGKREFSFVVYNSEKALADRGPFMMLKRQE